MNTTQYDYRKPSTIETLESDIEALLKINKSEKQLVIAGLESYLANPPDANAEFELSNLIVSATPGSSLQLAQQAGQSKLNDMLRSDEFLSLEELSSLPNTATYLCDSKKNVYVIVDDNPMHIDDLLMENEVLSQYLDELSEYASKAGGFIYSSDDINIEQWLRFYGHPMPSTATQLVNLVDFFNKKRPELSASGDYHEILKNPDIFPTALSLAQREKVQKVTETFGARGRGQLLNLLFEQAISAPVDVLRFDPHQHIHGLMASAIGKIWAEGYLEALGWYGTNSGESPSQEDLQQLLLAAILLNIDPTIGEVENKGRVMGYELYKPANAERHPSQVLLDLEKHLVDNNVIDAKAAPLAAYILAADVAPELVVKNIPADMIIGAPGWLVHSVTVAKIETIAPGSSRAMSYEHVQTYSDIEPFDEQLEQLFSLIVIEHVLNWGAVNNIIPYSADGEYTADNFCTAEAHYAKYTEALEQCSEALSTPLPTREEVALEELKRVLPGGDYLTEKNYLHPDFSSGEVSIHELFMSGDLLNHGWTGNAAAFNIVLVKANDLDLITPYTHSLKNIQTLYKEKFDNYFKQLQLGTATALKLALSKLPEKDRICLEHGTLSLYTARKKFSDHSTQETQRQRDKHRGRYGVIICAQYNSQRYYYELFTLRAVCNSRHDLRNVFEETAIEYFDPTESADKDKKQWQTQALDWPLDIDAYLNGTEPVKGVTNKLVVEKLWESYEAERGASATWGQLETFFSQKTEDIVDKVLEYFPPTKHDELYDVGYGITPLEAARKNSKENLDLILNLIIPFKSCIEDLTSGDPDREASGAFGCALDALAVVGAVVGVVPKLASIAAKSGKLLVKALKLVKLSASFSLSLVNPLDGVPSLMKKGAKLTKNGALLITGHGVKTSGKATRKLRSVSGTLDALNAAKSLNCVDVKIAHWESIGELSQAADVLVLKRGNDWYHLSLNSYQPRGAKITSYLTAFR